MNMMIITNSSSGLYSFRKELIKEIIYREHAVSAVLPITDRADELASLGVKLIDVNLNRRGTNPIADLKLFLQYIRLLKSESPDLVVTYTIKPNVYGGLACRLLRIPYAANITGLGTAFESQGVLKVLVTLLYKMGLQHAGVVFFENSTNLEYFEKARIVRNEQACLLAGAGVNLDHYSSYPYPKDETETRFVFVGRVMREKGMDELLGAMRELVRRGHKCRLDLLGSLEEEIYAEQIKSAEQEGWLHYYGVVADVRPLVAAAHCLVLPSWHEGMANTNLEAAAMARPVITSDIPGCKEAVIDGESGFLCEPKNVQSLVECMEMLIQLPNKERAIMGQAGRTHMEQVFDKREVVKETLDRLLANVD